MAGESIREIIAKASNLALLRDDPGGALKLLKPALDKENERVPGSESAGLLHCSIGFVLLHSGQLDAADGHLRKAEDILAQTAPRGVDYGLAILHRGRLEQRKGNWEEAFFHWKRAIEYWRSVLESGKLTPEGSIHTARTLHCLGEYFDQKDQYPEARGNYEQALGIAGSGLGAEHPDVIETCHRLGLLCARNGDAPAARGYLKQALPVLTRELGPTHPAVLEVQRVLASLPAGGVLGFINRLLKRG